MPEKIVLYPGSFNPPTLAHLKSIQVAMDHVGADAGFLIATSQKELKGKMTRAGSGFVLPDDIRCRMLQELAKADPRLIFYGHEKSHSLGTVAGVKAENPGAEVYYLAGADKLNSLPSWDNAKELVSTTEFIVFERGDKSVSRLLHEDELLRKYTSSFIVLPALESVSHISSTKVRRCFSEGDRQGYREMLLPCIADILDTLEPAALPAPTFEEIYKAIKGYGRRGQQNANKMVAAANTEIFPGLEGREEMLAGTTVYSEEFSVAGTEPKYSDLHIGCTKSNLVAAAGNLIGAGHNPAVVSTSSRVKACPGYHNGEMRLSENYLCRCSNLSESLFQYGDPKLKDVKESGVPPKGCAYPLDIRFGGIYSPGVRFFRKGRLLDYAPLDAPFACSVISVPTLSNLESDAGAVLRAEHSLFIDDVGHLRPEGRDIMTEKIRTMLRIAIVNGHDSLVIGDFAVCRNVDAGEVAEIFSQVLAEPEFTGRLSDVVFAFDEGKGNKRYPVEEAGKFGAFYNLFGRY